MSETINTKWLDHETERIQLLRWEDDGGRVFEIIQAPLKVGKGSNFRPKGVAWDVHLFKKHPFPMTTGIPIKGEPE